MHLGIGHVIKKSKKTYKILAIDHVISNCKKLPGMHCGWGHVTGKGRFASDFRKTGGLFAWIVYLINLQKQRKLHRYPRFLNRADRRGWKSYSMYRSGGRTVKHIRGFLVRRKKATTT
ncbi:hypothetical protein ANTPLA_LOCUS1775 [Anthophora plagiata]